MYRTGRKVNRRITKSMKICGNVDSRELRQGIKIDFEFSNIIQSKLFKKLDCGHSKRKKRKLNL